MHRPASFLSKGVNCYVPKMQYASLLHRGPTEFSLGTPSAVSATAVKSAVVANATATTLTDISYTFTAAEGTFGRTLRITPSADPGATGGTFDIFGEDWLGQPMVERFSGTNGSVAILYGKKAFKRVNYAAIVTASTNAINWQVGTGYRLGLPFKGDLNWAKEGGVLVPLYKRSFEILFPFSDADITAGGSILYRAPCPGYVDTLYGIPSGSGSTTNAAATVEIETVAVTGLTVTADQDTQTLVSDTPTTAGYNANNRFRPGDRIEVVQAATTSAGQTSYSLVIQPTQFTLPVLTDPQTTTTGDPRGTYESIATFDGSTEIIVGLVGDPSYNSSGNGGLHGIKHVVS